MFIIDYRFKLNRLPVCEDRQVFYREGGLEPPPFLQLQTSKQKDMKKTITFSLVTLGFCGLLLLSADSQSDTAFCLSKLAGSAMLGAAVLGISRTERRQNRKKDN